MIFSCVNGPCTGVLRAFMSGRRGPRSIGIPVIYIILFIGVEFEGSNKSTNQFFKFQFNFHFIVLSNILLYFIIFYYISGHEICKGARLQSIVQLSHAKSPQTGAISQKNIFLFSTLMHSLNLNQSIFTEIISGIWLIYSNLFLAIWIS